MSPLERRDLVAAQPEPLHQKKLVDDPHRILESRLPQGIDHGLAVLDHPGNPPSLWHNLGPIAMVNPCIVAPGPVSLKAGQPLRPRINEAPDPFQNVLRGEMSLVGPRPPIPQEVAQYEPWQRQRYEAGAAA